MPRNRPLVRRHRGAAVVELAVILPVFVLILLGTIEACSMIFLQQSLEIAAYEGARVALVPKSQVVNVEAAVSQLLVSRRTQNFSVVVTPSDFASKPYGTFIQVRVEAQCNSNSLFLSKIYQGRTLQAQVEMMKER